MNWDEWLELQRMRNEANLQKNAFEQTRLLEEQNRQRAAEQKQQAHAKAAQQEREAKERQEFDDQNDPCPYCQTQIAKSAIICPSCRNGFFGFEWDLIREAVIASPAVVEGLTSEKLATAIEKVKPARDARILEENRLREEARKKAEAKALADAAAAEKLKTERERQYKIEQERLAQSTRKTKKILAIVLGIIGLILVGSRILEAIFPPSPEVDVYANGFVWNENSARMLKYGSNIHVVVSTPSKGLQTFKLEGTGCRISGNYISSRKGSGSCKLTVEMSKSSNPSFAATQIERTLALTTAKPVPPKLFRTARVGVISKPLPTRTRIGTKSVKWKWKSATPSRCTVRNYRVVGKLPGYCKLIASTNGVKHYVSATNRKVRIVKILKP